jgi:hypothetical protein
MSASRLAFITMIVWGTFSIGVFMRVAEARFEAP